MLFRLPRNVDGHPETKILPFSDEDHADFSEVILSSVLVSEGNRTTSGSREGRISLGKGKRSYVDPCILSRFIHVEELQLVSAQVSAAAILRTSIGDHNTFYP